LRVEGADRVAGSNDAFVAKLPADTNLILHVTC
jgi:hypothetical protein